MFGLAFIPRVVSVEGHNQVQVSEITEPSEKIIPIRIYGTERTEIIDEIYRRFGSSAEKALAVFRCESSLKEDAFNPEIEAKKRWRESGGKYGTQYSSCGIAQINSVECGTSNTKPQYSPLYDVDYNLKQAKTLYDARGWQPWKICGSK